MPVWVRLAGPGALLLLLGGLASTPALALTCPPGMTAGPGGCRIGVPLPGQQGVPTEPAPWGPQQPDVQPTPSPSPFSAPEPPAGDLAGVGIQQVQWWVLSSAGHELQQLRPMVLQPTLAPGDWFRPLYGRMTAIAVWLLGLFLLLAALQALVRGDLALLGEAVLKHLPAAVLATAGVVSFALLLMRVVDELCGFVLEGLGDQVWRTLTDAAGVALAAAANPGWWGFWATLLGVLGLLAVIAIGLELLARMALIYLALLFLPLAFAAMVWPAARGLVRRLLELLVGLVVSKLVLVVVLVMAGVAFAAGMPVLPDQHPAQGEPAIADLLMGVILLLIGAMSPWVLVRLIPLVEAAASEHFHHVAINRHPLLIAPQVWRDQKIWWEQLHRLARRRGGGQPDPMDGGDAPHRPEGGPDDSGGRSKVPVVASAVELGLAGARSGSAAAGVLPAAVGAGRATTRAAIEPLRERAGVEGIRRGRLRGEAVAPSSGAAPAFGEGVPIGATSRREVSRILLPGPGTPGRGEILLPDGRSHLVRSTIEPPRPPEGPPPVSPRPVLRPPVEEG